MYYMNKDKTVTARIPSDLIERVDATRLALAKAQGYPALSRSQVIEQALEEWWEFSRHMVHDTTRARIRSRLNF
jgi:hypothetical protein